jgi:hypothetical protein
MPQGRLDRFGLPSTLARIVCGFRGRIDLGSWPSRARSVSVNHKRVSVHVALLELALALDTNSLAARDARAIGGRLSRPDMSPETQAMRALEELRPVLGAAIVTKEVESKSGVQRPRVARPLEMVRRGADAMALRVVLVKRSERHYTTTVRLGASRAFSSLPEITQ